MAKKIGILNSLQFALEHLVDRPLGENEFVFDDFYSEALKIDPKLSRDQAQNRIRKMLEKGQLICRKVRHNGKSANAYSTP